MRTSRFVVERRVTGWCVRLPLLLALCAAVTSTAARAQPVETATAPAFGTVTIYRTAGTPQEVVLLLSGPRGWDSTAAAMAVSLRDAGALVVGIDTRALTSIIAASGGCGYPARDLEELSAPSSFATSSQPTNVLSSSVTRRAARWPTRQSPRRRPRRSPARSASVSVPISS